jgi:DNA-binding MarR family transcriptional regulator
MSPTALAEATTIEPGGVSRGVKSLIDKKLVERIGAPGDRRRALLAATPDGQRLYRELFPQLAEINRRLVSVLDEQESVLLEALLRRLTDQARAIEAAGGGVVVKTERRLGGSRRFW